jgi:hypothetical protein
MNDLYKPEDFVGVEIIDQLGETSADTTYRAPHTSELKQMAKIANLKSKEYSSQYKPDCACPHEG